MVKVNVSDYRISANALAFHAQQTWNVPVPGIALRGLARGDNGPAILPRFAERNADGTNHEHTYTLAEAWTVLRALAARKSRRVAGLTAEAVAKAAGMPPEPKPASRAKPATTVARSLGQRAVRVKPATVAETVAETV